MSSVNELGWLAGIADGEGSFYISKGKLKSGNAPHFRISFAVSNTNELIMKGVKRIVSDLLGREKRYIPIKISGNQKATWNLQITRFDDLKIFCEAILPYLEGKKEQAKTMIEYCNLLADNTIAENGIRKSDPIVLRKRTAFAVKMGWLNRHLGQSFPSSANDLTGSSLELENLGMKEKSELYGDVQNATEMIASTR
jgi:hypothetical protein